jgi:hypothetical protein
MFLTPTLVVGLGGTGAQVVGRLKRTLRRYFASRNLGDIPPVIRFLVVDTMDLSGQSRDLGLEDAEYANIGNVSGNDVLLNPRYYPEIFGSHDKDGQATQARTHRQRRRADARRWAPGVLP